MIRVGQTEPRVYISQYMFSVISPGDVRYQVVWRQYVSMNGNVIGIGGLEQRKSSYLQDRIRKMREDYLKRTKKKKC